MEDRIRAYLAEKLEAPDLQLIGVQRIAVGWSHETWLFDAVWSEGTQGFCLRRDPGNALLRELSDLATQFRVLQCLADTEVPAPKPYFYEDDPAILDAPFLVMEKVPGVCPSPWGRDGRKFYEDAAARGVLPDSFTDSLVTLHTVDWKAAGLDFLGVPENGNFASREVAKWRHLMEETGQKPDPILVDLLGWLEANAPPHRPAGPRPRRVPHRQLPDPRGPGVRPVGLGDPGDRGPDVRRRLRAQRPQPGRHRAVVEPGRTGRLLRALRGGDRHQDRRRPRAATTTSCTPCAPLRSG